MFRIKRPLILLTLYLAIGIVIGKFAPVAFLFYVGLVVATPVVAFYFYQVKNDKRAALWIFFTIFLWVGATTASGRERFHRKITPDLKKGEIVWITGRIVSDPQLDDGEGKMIVEILKLGDNKLPEGSHPKAVVYFSPDKLKGEEIPFKYGKFINFSGIAFPPQEPSNPHQFDYQEYLRGKDVVTAFYLPNPAKAKIRAGEGRNFIGKAVFFLRTRIEKNTRKYLPGKLGELLVGIMLGRSKALDPETREYFRRIGTAHVLAASGLHVSIVIGFVLLVLYPFNVNKKIKYLLALPPVILYAMLAGGSPSIVRASIMGAIFLIALALEKEYDPLNALFAAGFAILLLNPFNLFKVSFLLSFTAVFGIIVSFGKIRRAIPIPSRDKIHKKLKSKLRGKLSRLNSPISFIVEAALAIVIISFVVQLWLIPILAYYFNRIALVNTIANLVMIPVASFVLPTGLAGSIGSIIFPGVGRFLLHLASYPLALAVFVAQHLASWQWASFRVPSPSAVFSTFYYAFLLVVFSGTNIIKQNRKVLLSIILAIGSALVLYSAYKLYNKQRIVFFDTPNNPAAIIHKKGGSCLFIYCKHKKVRHNEDPLDFSVKPYLEKEGINRLEALIIRGRPGARVPDLHDIASQFKVKNVFISPVLKYEEIDLFKGDNVGKRYILDRDFEVKLRGGNLLLKGVVRDYPFLDKYRCSGGKVIFTDLYEPLNPAVLCEVEASSFSILAIFGKFSKKQAHSLKKLKNENKLSVINYSQNTPEQFLSPNVDGALMFDLSSPGFPRIKWR